MGVALFDNLTAARLLVAGNENPRLTRRGAGFVSDFGIDLDALAKERRPLCKSCLDWSQRRYHLSGALGAAMLQRIYDLGWARRDRSSRAVHFSAEGERAFRRLLNP